MKQGRTITELAQEIERQANSKRDFIADTRKLRIVTPNDRGSSIHLEGIDRFGVTELCHGQIASRLEIPKKYYDRMRKDAHALLDNNVNHWFNTNHQKRMVRTLDGNARAFLSDRYRPLDNFDLAKAVLPIISDKGCQVVSSELTERRLYLKCVNPRIEGEVNVGDIVQAGVIISNSEVGCGSIRIEPLVYRLSCKNGMVSNDFAMRKYHVGRGGDDMGTEAVEQFYKDETRQADDKALWLKVRDVVDGALDQALFNQIVGKMKEAAGIKMEADPIECVGNVAKRFDMNKDEESGVLKFLIEGGDLSLWGVLNAVTRQSQEVEDYDRATDLERIGGQILEMPDLIRA